MFLAMERSAPPALAGPRPRLFAAALAAGAFVFCALLWNLWFSAAPPAALGDHLGEAPWRWLVQAPGFRHLAGDGAVNAERWVRLQILGNLLLLAGLAAVLGAARAASPERRLLCAALLAAWLPAIGVLVLDPVAFGLEESAIRWFQSAGLVATGLCAVANAELVRRLPHASVRDRRLLTRLWLLIAAAFAFGALDEQFQIHESIGVRLRRWPMPDGRGSVDDYIVLSFGVGALALTLLHVAPLRRVYLREKLGAAGPFGVALLLALAVGGIDLLELQGRATKLAGHLEEVVESTAAMCFLAGFAATARRTLERIGSPQSSV